jgi:hypothetical protein
MTLAGRSARRGQAGIRWLVIGVVITLLVLLVDASYNSRSPGPAEQLSEGAWVDRALPIVATSNEEGQAVSSLWTNGLTMPGATISGVINQVAAGSAEAYKQVAALHAPSALAGPAGLLQASLLARSRAAAQLQVAFSQTLGAAAQETSTPADNAATSPGTTTSTSTSSTSTTTTTVPANGATTTLGSSSTTSVPSGPPAISDAVIQAVETAANDMQIGDQAYQLFLASMPSNIGVKMPNSVWLTNPAQYQPQATRVFLDSLQSTLQTQPVHQVEIYSVTTSPAPVARSGDVLVLPDEVEISVTLVLANTGNQEETGLTVTASLSAAGPGPQSAQDLVNLAPGQAQSVVGLGPVAPPQGYPVTLTITVAPPAGSPMSPVTQSLTVEMPSPVATTSTTTTPASSGSGGGIGTTAGG